MGEEGGQGLDTPSPPLAKLLCCELLVFIGSLLWGSHMGGGGERAFSTVLNLGVGGGSTSVHLILWCSLTHKSAHFSFFFCFFFFFFFLMQVALSKRTYLCVSSHAVFLFLCIAK